MRLASETPKRSITLTQLRKRQGITQVELAKKLGIKQANISRSESRGDMFVSTLAAYLEALDAELEISVKIGHDVYQLQLGKENSASQDKAGTKATVPDDQQR